MKINFTESINFELYERVHFLEIQYKNKAQEKCTLSGNIMFINPQNSEDLSEGFCGWSDSNISSQKTLFKNL